MEVVVTQYLMPNGRQSQSMTDVPDACAADYERMKSYGMNLAAEVLGTGLVSLTIEDREREADFACELVCNGPDVQDAYARILAACTDKAIKSFQRRNPK